jgi:hypothetical protein
MLWSRKLRCENLFATLFDMTRTEQDELQTSIIHEGVKLWPELCTDAGEDPWETVKRLPSLGSVEELNIRGTLYSDMVMSDYDLSVDDGIHVINDTLDRVGVVLLVANGKTSAFVAIEHGPVVCRHTRPRHSVLCGF